MPHSKILQPVQWPKFPASDDMANGYEVLDDENSIEKDKTETKLEKVVFGDDSGFQEGLKSYKDSSAELQGLLAGQRQRILGSLEDGGLEYLDDANVSKSNCASAWLSLNIFPAVLPRLHSVHCERPRLTASINL